MWFGNKINPKKIKEKNTKELRSMGIDVIEHLPFFDDPKFREPEEIARRAMVLHALFQLYLHAPKEVIGEWLTQNGLIASLTDDEWEYLEVDYTQLPEQTRINIYWNIEAIWAFTWIGGFHHDLTFNTGVRDSLHSFVPNIEQNESAEKFIHEFKLRNKVEIFEMFDKFYRAHWFARNNYLTGQQSDKVDLDIIIERRKALQYTVFSEYDWDEISLDT